MRLLSLTLSLRVSGARRARFDTTSYFSSHGCKAHILSHLLCELSPLSFRESPLFLHCGKFVSYIIVRYKLSAVREKSSAPWNWVEWIRCHLLQKLHGCIILEYKMTTIGGQFYLYLNVNCKWTANRNQAQLFNIEIQKILSKWTVRYKWESTLKKVSQSLRNIEKSLFRQGSFPA